MFDFSGRSLEDSARITQMKAAWDAYAGRLGPSLQNRPRKVSDAVAVNRCKPIVDKGVAYLFGKDVTFQVASDAGESEQVYLDACWKANRKMTLLQKVGINGGVCGHVFLKIVPARPYARLIAIDPTMVTVEYQPDDVDTINAYVIEYSGVDAKGQTTDFRQDVRRSSPASWKITDQEKLGGIWMTKEVTTWPYAFSPIVECQNLPAPNQFWGTSDITSDLIQLNRDLNLVLSNVQRIIKYHAHPKTWVTGLGGNKISTGPDETLVLPEGASMGALEMHSDLSSSLNFANVLETAMDVLSRTPNLALGDMADVPRGTISGTAIELLLSPLLEKTDTKRRLYGDMLEDLCRRLLVLGGFDGTVEIFIHWPEILPDDALANAAVAQAYLALGVSHDTVFQRLKLSYDEERDKLAAEAEVITPAPEQVLPPTPATSESATEPVVADTVFGATLRA